MSFRELRVRTAKDGKPRYTWQVRGPWGSEAQTFKRRTEARAWAVALDAKMMGNGRRTDPNQTLAGAWTEWIESHTGRPNTIRNHRQVWRLQIEPTALATARLSDLGDRELRRWVKHQYTHFAPGTAAKHCDTLRAILSSAVRAGELSRNPLDRDMEPKVQTDEVVVPELDEALAMIDGLPPQHSILAVMGMGMGVRYSEAAGLDVDHVNFFRRDAHIAQQAQRVTTHDPRYESGLRWTLDQIKTAQGRHIDMDDYVLHALVAHLRRFPAGPHGLIAATRNGTPVLPPTFSKSWAKTRADLGLRGDFTFHGLRHYHASALIDAGWSLAEVAARLGDTVATVERIYTHRFRKSAGQRRGVIDAAVSAHRGGTNLAHESAEMASDLGE